MKYVVPMKESERGWGSKIDGYAGPFDSYADADAWKRAYNLKYNNEPTVPDWYIAALEPIVYRNQTCDYRIELR